MHIWINISQLSCVRRLDRVCEGFSHPYGRVAGWGCLGRFSLISCLPSSSVLVSRGDHYVLGIGKIGLGFIRGRGFLVVFAITLASNGRSHLLCLRHRYVRLTHGVEDNHHGPDCCFDFGFCMEFCRRFESTVCKGLGGKVSYLTRFIVGMDVSL